jgi:hypothetical protein
MNAYELPAAFFPAVRKSKKSQICAIFEFPRTQLYLRPSASRRSVSAKFRFFPIFELNLRILSSFWSVFMFEMH